ncbi:sensor histidine kinase [Microvirga sesbaniae]|uniref:sensor histidine kinase n=1 Tax=Microvirga sesbaniae TaxID=681392 RepID=UPI00290560ED|nr:HWE histidine kinase domain-containing protein [Microvirga sp. HBU67692]
MNTTTSQSRTVWPAGGGEMGERIRQHDWAATALGPVGTWPQSLKTAVDIMLASPGPVAILWGADRIQLYNDGYIAVAAARHPSILGRPAADSWSEAYESFLGPVFERVFDGEAVAIEDHVVLLRRAEGDGFEERHFAGSFSPIRDETGAVGGVFHPLTETTARIRADAALRESERQARLLLAELQHRVRNTLAVIRSIARRTAVTSETAEDYAMHLDGRIDAFARVQAAVTRDPTAGLDLELLVAEGLLAFGAQEGERVAGITGPEVRLKPKAAETIALVIHELATNAVKYGALSTDQGRITVEWTITREEGGPRLVFRWIETGVRLSGETPRRRGFGTELIERTLAYELDGKASLEFTPDGLHCIISLPTGGVLAEQVLPR